MFLHMLQKVNAERCKEFRDSQGRICHPNGVSDWTPAQWLQALTGEVGEYANLRKKFERGDTMSPSEFHERASDELADVQCYLVLLAESLGINLEEATIRKFNEVSDRIGSAIKL